MQTGSDFPRVNWQTIRSKQGVTLLAHGEGEPVFVFPGMEGSGESCLHLAYPVLQQATQDGKPYRLILVNYAHEEHDRLDALIGTIGELIASVASITPCTFWAQSFGNLLVCGAAERVDLRVRKFVLVSPFTKLPAWKAHGGTMSMYVTPTFAYRATIKPLGRYLFGPAGDRADHPFFDALQRGTSAIVRRRTGWLRSRDFSSCFRSLSAPAKAWLGTQDRLVNLGEQKVFFAELARTRSNWHSEMVQGSGHVVLPSHIVQNLRSALHAWLVA